MNIKNVLNTVFLYFFLALWSAVVFVLFSPLFLTFNRKIVTWMGYIWAYVLIKYSEKICGIEYQVEGEENIPQAPFIIASKHQSTWETVFFTMYFRTAKFILKKELTRIPFYGWYLLLTKMIYIDRKQGLRAIKKIVEDTKAALLKGDIIAIFPEGTRVKPKQSKEYQPGVAAIAFANPEVPVLPIALNSGDAWPKAPGLITPCKIKVKFLPILLPSGTKKEFLDKLKKIIDGESEKLNA